MQSLVTDLLTIAFKRLQMTPQYLNRLNDNALMESCIIHAKKVMLETRSEVEFHSSDYLTDLLKHFAQRDRLLR